MKKITKITSVSTGIISLLLGNTALAQTTEPDSYKLLPNDVHIVGQFNASEKHPLESLLEEGLKSMDSTLQYENQSTLSADLKSFLSTTSYTFATRMKDDLSAADVFLLMKASKTQYNMFIKVVASMESNATTSTETYKNVDITTTTSEYGSTSSTAYVKGYLVFSENIDALKEVIDMGQKTTTSTSFVKEQTGHEFLADNFFNLYIDPSYIESMMEKEMDYNEYSRPSMTSMFLNPEYQKKVFAAVKAEAISFAQTDKGLKYNVIVKAKDAESLKTLGVDPVKNSFVPSIYN